MLFLLAFLKMLSVHGSSGCPLSVFALPPEGGNTTASGSTALPEWFVVGKVDKSSLI